MTHEFMENELPGYWRYLFILCGTLIGVCLVDLCWFMRVWTTVHPDGSRTKVNPITGYKVNYEKDGSEKHFDGNGRRLKMV